MEVVACDSEDERSVSVSLYNLLGLGLYEHVCTPFICAH